MSDPGFASLGPTLLARKGGAKPAMRPQIAPLVQDEVASAPIAEEQLEDLGWNDMGDADPAMGADIVPINGDITADQIAAGGFVPGGGPIVRRQQRRLEERVLADAVMTGPEDREPEEDEEDGSLYAVAYGDAAEEDYSEEDYSDDEYALDTAASVPQPIPAAAVALPAARSARVPAVQAGRRAAFTLRLDADRHLKLRLAATMQGVSAQALVTEALDRLLAEYGDLDIIANHLKRH